MDETIYADPSVAAAINDGFVPVRVDADCRPDIAERYGLGGWPTTAFLSPDGEILGGGTFVTRERMPGVLAQVAAAFAAHRDSLPAAPVDTPAATPTPTPAALQELVFASFDSAHGGFGGAPKFPHVAPVRLALDLWRESRDERLEEIIVTTLDAMGWGPLYDEVDGGFFRCSAGDDWREPQSEKLLEINAALLRLYIDAGDALEIARFTERATDVLRYTQTWLADPVDGGWSGSQKADDVYYAGRSIEARRELTPPDVPRVLYADANAAMVSAVIHAGRRFDDGELTSFGIKALERVLVACYRPGTGVAHYFEDEPQVRGLIGDQLAMAAASLDAFDVTGNIVYEMMAEELAHYMIRVLWDDEEGGFFDAALEPDTPPVGLLRQRVKPFVANCEAVSVFRRLAGTSGEAEFSRRADGTLQAMSSRAAGQGALAAHYLLALRQR